MRRTAVNRAQTPLLLAIAIAFGVAACDRSADRSASAKPELMPTAPAIAPPPADPAPVMPPKADAVLGPQTTAAAPAGNEQPATADQTAKGSDPKAKEPMSKEEESTAMPKPAQANDHSTTATDSKQ